MFKLKENNFIDQNRCKYEDEWGNTLLCIREKDGFTARLRFSDERIIAKPNHVVLHLFEIDRLDGTKLEVDFKEGAIKDEKFYAAVEGYGEIMSRWVGMIGDIQFMGLSPEHIRILFPNLNADDKKVASQKINALSQYEELKPLVSSLLAK